MTKPRISHKGCRGHADLTIRLTWCGDRNSFHLHLVRQVGTQDGASVTLDLPWDATPAELTDAVYSSAAIFVEEHHQAALF